MGWWEAGQARYDRFASWLGWLAVLAVVLFCLYGALSAVFEISMQTAQRLSTGTWHFVTIADTMQTKGRPVFGEPPPGPLRVPVVVVNLFISCWVLRLGLRALNGADAGEQEQP